MLNTHYLYKVIDMSHNIAYGCLSTGAQKSVVEGHLCHSILLGKRSQLVISKIARMITQAPAATVAAHDRNAAYMECVIETGFSRMAHVHHHAQLVHPLNHLLPEGTHTPMFGFPPGRVTDIIVAVVA